MTIDRLSWTLIGYGRVGRALTRVFDAAGFDLRAICEIKPITDEWLRGRSIPVAAEIRSLPIDVKALFFCVPDREIGRMVQGLMPLSEQLQGLTVAHTAGSLGASVLSPLKAFGAQPLAWHPLQSFTGAETADCLRGVTIGMDGSEAAMAVGRQLATAAGAKALVVPEELRTLYHLSGVFASNLLAGLIGAAADFLKEIGLDDRKALRALEPIIRTTVENIMEQGLPSAITGPAARDDHDTVKRHLEALRLRPEERDIYQSLTRRLLKYLAKEQVGGISTLV